MSQIFVSYSRTDLAVAGSLVKDLERKRYSVWIDRRLTPGDEWEQEITKAIEEAKICLVIVSPDAIVSQWVQREVELARQKGKRIIPLVMRTVAPTDLEKLSLDSIQFIDYAKYGYQAGFQQLLETLPPIPIDNTDDSETRDTQVLVIEDIPSQQAIIKQALSDLHILSVGVASNFDQALKLIRAEAYDLITLDMQLDEMDKSGMAGYALLDQLQTYQKDVPVIIISALDWSGQDVRNFLRKYRAFDYLSKPFDPQELKRIIEEALRKS